jgi:hypothetical protein
MTKLNSAQAPNAEMQLRSAVLNSLEWSDDCHFWSKKVPCISVSNSLLDKVAGFPNKFGCSPELVQSRSPISKSLPAPCTDACPDPDAAVALSVLHFDCAEADDRPVPTDRALTLAR